MSTLYEQALQKDATGNITGLNLSILGDPRGSQFNQSGYYEIQNAFKDSLPSDFNYNEKDVLWNTLASQSGAGFGSSQGAIRGQLQYTRWGNEENIAKQYGGYLGLLNKTLGNRAPTPTIDPTGDLNNQLQPAPESDLAFGPTAPQPQVTQTPTQTTTQPTLDQTDPNAISKTGGYYKVGNDVFDQTGRHIQLDEFQRLGLNFALLPEGQSGQQVQQPQLPQTQTATDPNAVSKTGGYYKIGNDVFDKNGRHIDQAEFQKLGLNFALLPEGSGSPQPPTGTPSPTGTPTSSSISGVYKMGTDVYVTENGVPRKIGLDEFKQLGINYDFLKEGQPVSLEEAIKGSRVLDTMQEYGATTTPDDFLKNPTKSFEQTYMEVLNALGATSIKAEFEKIQKQFGDLNDELNDKIADINEDPWLTEGVRVTRIRKLQERYEGKLGNLENQMKLYDSLYQQSRDEARFVAGQALEQFNKDRTFQQDQLQYLQERADKQAEAQARLSENMMTPDIKEYQLARSQGYTGSFLDWQRQNANLKANGGDLSGLTPKQITTFNQIVGQYNRSPLVLAADRTPILRAAIDSVKKDPSNAAQQLNLSYAYIQALDTYQSAVREGELGNLNSIDSKIGELQGSIQKMQNGQVVRPEIALQIAGAATNIIDTIAGAAQAKAASFRSQAQVSGIGDAWDKYIGGFNPSYDSGGDFWDSLNGSDSGGGDFWSSFNSEGSGSNNAPVKSIAEAIGQIESSGSYTARGPQTSSGDYAYGKYQIMGTNIPTWSKEALGYSITKDQFLKSPQLQDQIAYYKMNQYLQQYGSADNVATAWFAGPGAVNTNSQAQDVTGTSVPEYLRRFRTALSNHA